MIEVTSPRGLPVPKVATNKNTNWLDNKASWLFYVLLIVVSWLVISNWTDPGLAWTYVHIAHGVITYYLLHWNKGSPIQDDQGKYDSLTFWEQIDNGVQFTSTRKFFIAVPVALFLLASHTSDFRRQPLGVNFFVVVVLVVAKLSSMHKVRIMGINKY
jgi:hypothetical protein